MAARAAVDRTKRRCEDGGSGAGTRRVLKPGGLVGGKEKKCHGWEIFAHYTCFSCRRTRGEEDQTQMLDGDVACGRGSRMGVVPKLDLMQNVSFVANPGDWHGIGQIRPDRLGRAPI